MATRRHNAVASAKTGIMQQEQTTLNQNRPRHQNPNMTLAEKLHKTENCWDGANAANDPRKKKREFTIPTNKIGDQPVPTPSSQPKN